MDHLLMLGGAGTPQRNLKAVQHAYLAAF